MKWTLKRNDNNAIVQFDEDIQWIDEHKWNAVKNSPEFSISGSLIVQQGVKLNGRPITLSGDWVWHKRSAVETVRIWSDVPELEMTLTHYDGRTFNVMFRQQDDALDALPVVYRTSETSDDQYLLTVNLMTI